MPIAEFQLESPILRETLHQLPDLVVTVEAQYEYDESIYFLFWVEEVDFDAVPEALATDSTVTRPKKLTETPTKHLYRTCFTKTGYAASTYDLMRDWDIVLLDAHGTHEGWTVRLLFPTQEALSAYYDECTERGLAPTILTKYEEVDAPTRANAELTPAQWEALTTAFEAGYFEIPRQTSLDDIADQLGISAQAASERIRRAEAALLDRQLNQTVF